MASLSYFFIGAIHAFVNKGVVIFRIAVQAGQHAHMHPKMTFGYTRSPCSSIRKNARLTSVEQSAANIVTKNSLLGSHDLVVFL